MHYPVDSFIPMHIQTAQTGKYGGKENMILGMGEA